jgi:bifunctional DNase/RNase
MERRELKLMGLSYSQSQIGSYVAVLADIESDLKLPIIIKPHEAHKIAMELDSVKTPNPMIYDLFMNLSQNFGIDLVEVYIHNLIEGKFYTNLTFTDQVDDSEIDSSVGDALALAVMYGSPIYVNIEILKIAGVYINDDGTVIDKSKLDKDKVKFLDKLEKKSDKSRIVSVENLEKMIEDAIINEEYEVAAELRDKINKIKANK